MDEWNLKKGDQGIQGDNLHDILLDLKCFDMSDNNLFEIYTVYLFHVISRFQLRVSYLYKMK